jgi:hypothetical protein
LNASKNAQLEEAVEAGGLKAGFVELLDGVGLGFAKAFAAGVAAFEGIVGKQFDVGPPGVAVEVGSGGSLLGRRNDGKGKEENQRRSVTHENQCGAATAHPSALAFT